MLREMTKEEIEKHDAIVEKLMQRTAPEDRFVAILMNMNIGGFGMNERQAREKAGAVLVELGYKWPLMIDGSKHDAGDKNCTACWSHPLQCCCGGYIHDEFAEDDPNGKPLLSYACDRCGDSYSNPDTAEDIK